MNMTKKGWMNLSLIIVKVIHNEAKGVSLVIFARIICPLQDHSSENRLHESIQKDYKRGQIAFKEE